jgi:hypothetical protein
MDKAVVFGFFMLSLFMILLLGMIYILTMSFTAI